MDIGTRFLLAGFVATTVSTVIAVPELAPQRYVAPNGSTVEGIGVCAPTVEDVSCWDMHGTADPNLSELVRAKLLTEPRSLNLVFRRKNRILVLRHSSDLYLNFSFQDGRYAPETQIADRNGEGSMRLISFDSGLDVESASLNIKLQSSQPESFSELQPKLKAQTTLGGKTFQVSAIKRSDVSKAPNSSPFGQGDKTIWEIHLTGPTLSDPDAQLYASGWKDNSGRAVNWVNNSGRLVAQTPETAFVGPTARVRNISASVRFEEGGLVVVTNVNPTEVGRVNLVMNVSRNFVLTGFPLEPTRRINK